MLSWKMNVCYLFKVREEGVRLFVLWYAILMDNASDGCHASFRDLLTKLGRRDIRGKTLYLRYYISYYITLLKQFIPSK